MRTWRQEANSDGWKTEGEVEETHTHTVVTHFNVSWQTVSGQRQIIETSH